MTVRALVVGAGAVGLPYGRHLQLGGAEVTFLIKPRHAAELEDGVTLYALNDRRRRTTPVRWRGYDLVTGAEEVARRRWDQVYLTVASPALRGPWLPELMEASGDATIVTLQPGIDDRALILAHLPEERLVQGLIMFYSYPAPMPGETRFPAPGMAYFFPPLVSAPFSGASSPRVEAVVDALDGGGFPARRHPDVSTLADFPNAVMMPYLVALEQAGWSFAELARSPWLATAARGSREALALLRSMRGPPPALLALATRPAVIRAALKAVPHALPFDVETYLRVHFTKVGDQTRAMMARYLELAEERHLHAPALAELCARIGAMPVPGQVQPTIK